LIYTDSDLPTVLRACRQRERRTQREVARVLDRERGNSIHGPNRHVTPAHVSAWERGTARPQWHEVCTLADYLAAPELLFVDRAVREDLAYGTRVRMEAAREAELVPA
jgi:transcriptional regulator with XRE-family HTH domain